MEENKLKLFYDNFSLITVAENKIPNFTWKKFQTEKIGWEKFLYQYNYKGGKFYKDADQKDIEIQATSNFGIVTGFDYLEWCNSFENMQHASLNKKLYCSDFQKKQTSLANRGIKSHLSKLSEIDVIGIKKELQENIKTQKEISFLFNTTSANVGAIKRGKSWKHIKL